MEDFWQEHQRLGPLQRWMQALRHVVLTHREQPVVIFVDEIDVVRSLQQFSTDEFFAAIRECYNRRSADPAFNRLTFCLLGVATPSDLIQDTRTTPFKIGRRIELEDFTPAEAAPLATGLGRDEAHAGKLLKRILYWTGGHPYLTQRLCQAVARDASIHSAAGVDRLCEEMFLSTRARERDDNLLFVRERLLARDYDRATLLDLYRQVRERKRIRDDDTSSLISVLRLAGIVRVLEGYLWVRNRIYFRVFDREWIIANMPDAEIRRQQAAFRRGMIRASVVAAVIITCLGGGIYWYLDWYVLEHTVYYNPFAKRWGVPQGIGELTPEQVKGRAVSLKFSSKGRKGPVQKVQAVNDKDECNPQHEVGTYFKPETQSQITPYRECQWEFVRDLRGEIVYEMAYCSGRRSIPMRCRRCGTSAATFARGRSSDVEHQEYLDSLASAVCLQLQVPLGATGDSRGLLVDAYFAAEIWPSGSKKLFIRTDREHTFLHQGFALMGLYRPGERGSGNDMTVSVNPWTGIYLKALWEELERLEIERWQGQRPRDHIRPIASYQEGQGYNEPWWDDGGRYTLLGAPKALPDWPDGSRLDWSDVVEAAWRCYNPVRNLRVRDLLHRQDCTLEQCQRDRLHREGENFTLTKHLAAARWLPDAARPQALFLAPTTRQALAALVIREPAEGPLHLTDLPPEQDLTLTPLAGDFAVLHEHGVFLFDDWRSEHLPVDELHEEFHRCFQLLYAIREVDSRLDAHLQARSMLDPTLKPWRSIAVLTELAAQRAELARAQYHYGLHSPNVDVRRFRTQLASCWGIDKGIEDLQRRLTQLEDAVRTTSTLRTQGLVQILSVYGLPFFISGTITTALGPWLETWVDASAKGGASLLKVVVYLGLAAGLIIGVRGLQYFWSRSKILPKAPASRPVSDSQRPNH